MIIANKQDITAALYKIMEDGNKAVAAGKKLKLEISEFKETRSTAQKCLVLAVLLCRGKVFG